MTKLRKNDYQELRKGGLKAMDAKLVELKSDLEKTLMLKMKNELKNLKEGKITKIAIAKINTMKAELKGDK
jgi:ribosomal protein L29